MAQPEVILDRWVRAQARTRPQYAGYVGKLDLDNVQPRSLRSFLTFVQDSMSTALRLESANASGEVPHPLYHFDYLQVKDGTRNAIAFQYEGFSFIAVTLPLVQLLWDVSTRLANSAGVQTVLAIEPGTTRLEALRGLLFQFNSRSSSPTSTHTMYISTAAVETLREYGLSYMTKGQLVDCSRKPRN